MSELRVQFEELSELIFDVDGDPRTKFEIVKKIKETLAGTIISVPSMTRQSMKERHKRVGHAVNDMLSSGYSKSETVKAIMERFCCGKASAYMHVNRIIEEDI